MDEISAVEPSHLASLQSDGRVKGVDALIQSCSSVCRRSLTRRSSFSEAQEDGASVTFVQPTAEVKLTRKDDIVILKSFWRHEFICTGEDKGHI